MEEGLRPFRNGDIFYSIASPKSTGNGVGEKDVKSWRKGVEEKDVGEKEKRIDKPRP
jgi:hypothetical protein